MLLNKAMKYQTKCRLFLKKHAETDLTNNSGISERAACSESITDASKHHWQCMLLMQFHKKKQPEVSDTVQFNHHLVYSARTRIKNPKPHD